MNSPYRLTVALLACVVLCSWFSSSALGQTRPVSLRDQQQTALAIRLVDSHTNLGVRAIERQQAGTARLLERLRAINAPQMRIENVATHYKRSTSAIRFRQAARINRDADRQLLRLRALSNSEVLQMELEEARQAALADLAAVEAEALAAIDAALHAAQN